MSEWKTYRLGRVANITTGFPFKGDQYSSIGTRVLRGENIGDKVLRWDSHRDKRWCQPFERADDYALQADDIVLAMDGNVGKNKARIKTDDLPLLLAQRVACVRNNRLSDQVFLYYVLNSREFADYLNSVKTGTTIQHISMKQIADFEVSLPPLAEQKRIAGILGALDDKIELNRRINANLEEQVKALFKEWFVENRALNCFRGRLSDVVQIWDAQRKPLSGQERDKMQKIYPYYGAAALMDYVDDYLFDGIYLLVGEDGTVIDDSGFPVLQYVWGKFWVNNHAHVLTGIDGFSTESLYVLLQLTNVKSIVTGAVQPKINQANLKNVEIDIPTGEMLKRYEAVISPLFATIRSNHDEERRLSALRDALLPKLMRGEINV